MPELPKLANRSIIFASPRSYRTFSPSSMKRFLRKLCLLPQVIVLTTAALAQDGTTQKARVLIFGNSFSANSTTHLLELAKEGKKDLVLLNLVKGGCSLQEHAAAVRAAQTDPESPQARFYFQGGNVPRVSAEKKKANALEAIHAGPWDFISIQQYSLLSFKPETYEPYAKELVDFVKDKAPAAKLVVHETWAYREDDPLFKDGKFTSEKMYEAVKANYTKLANDYHASFLPIGDAFQAARKTPEWTYLKDVAFDFKSPPQGAIPAQKGSLNVGWIWKKPETNTVTPANSPTSDPNAAKDATAKFILDAHHANVPGTYLGSCVWYEFLFNDDVTTLTKYTPKGLSSEHAASLRRIAHETLAKQRQDEKR